MQGDQNMYQLQSRNKSPKSTAGAKRCIGIAVLALTCILSTRAAFGRPLPDVASKVDEVSTLLQNHQVARIEILHVPDSLLTRGRITPVMLRSISRVRVVVDNPWESASLEGLLASLQQVKSAKTRETGEVRWAILFFDATGKETCAIYLGSDGSLGI